MRLEIIGNNIAEILRELRNFLQDNNEPDAAAAVDHVARLRNIELRPPQPTLHDMEALINQARDQLGDAMVKDVMGWHGGLRLQDIAENHWAYLQAELRSAMSLPPNKEVAHAAE